MSEGITLSRPFRKAKGTRSEANAGDAYHSIAAIISLSTDT